MNKIFLILMVLVPCMANAQSVQVYKESIAQYRDGYKMSLLKGEDSLSATDTGYLRFYDADPKYRVRASFEQVSGAAPFRLETKHGRIGPQVREYGIVYFNMNGATITLHVYRIVTRPKFRILARFIKNTDEEIVLFIPFTDRTNNRETFLGGRYLDVSAAGLMSNNVVIDFNKACNWHTAYEMGYPYIVLPSVPDRMSPMEVNQTRLHPDQPLAQIATIQANDIPIEIKAGEKIFGHNPGY